MYSPLLLMLPLIGASSGQSSPIGSKLPPVPPPAVGGGIGAVGRTATASSVVPLGSCAAISGATVRRLPLTQPITPPGVSTTYHEPSGVTRRTTTGSPAVSAPITVDPAAVGRSRMLAACRATPCGGPAGCVGSATGGVVGTGAAGSAAAGWAVSSAVESKAAASAAGVGSGTTVGVKNLSRIIVEVGTAAAIGSDVVAGVTSSAGEEATAGAGVVAAACSSGSESTSEPMMLQTTSKPNSAPAMTRHVLRRERFDVR